MLDFSVYLLYRAGSAIASALPLPVLFVFGELLGFCAWIVLGNYRRLAQRNIAIAFGSEKSPRELRRLVRRHFQRLGANLLCSVKIAAMPLERVRAHVKIENADAAHRELRAGRPIVFVLSHLGNWELQAQMFPVMIGYVRNSTIFQPLGNRYIDKHVRTLRGRAGVELFDRREGFQKAIQLLRGGGAIGILSDQHSGDLGLWVPFFNKLASTSPLPGLLAKRTGAALLGTAIYTDGLARWRMVFTESIGALGDSIEALTAKANELIAAQIRRAPEDWFWVHNRWKIPEPSLLLARYKRGIYLPPDISGQDLQPFRILIRSSNWLGDAVMSVPAIRAIKNGRLDAHVTIATPAKIASMWKLVSEVDAIIPLSGDSLLTTIRLLRRQPSFDAAILFPNSLRVVLETWLSGIPRRVGYRGHARSWLLNQIITEPRRPGPLKHQSARYLRIAEELGAEITATLRLPPFHQQSTINHQPWKLGLCPGAEYGPAKRWLPERFAEAAAKVAAQAPVQWVLFGTPKDAEIGDQIAAGLGDSCVNRIGQTTLDQLILALRECR
ncbi:MAG TPA: glycosyltransferase family 9 protein, partial [Candidatus Baltobacteraceae bacterium]|nr:glycosyltransferase family 9 protein [Candidatus Baltobacteraceae bacterium]